MNKKLKKKLDVAFSKLIRQKGCCERCGKTESLQCSHIFGRKHLATRWDEDNATCLCVGCHLFWWHKNPVDAGRWIEEYRGKEFLDNLRLKAYSVRKWTDEEGEELLKEITNKLC